MLHKKLPTHIQVEQLCKTAPLEGTCLSGIIKISELIGLISEFADQGDTPVTISLLFSLDEDGLCCVKGEITVDLQLICQRCLQPMQQTIQSSVLVSPVSSNAAAAKLPSQYEPLLVTNGEVRLAEWIAEELHLALPLVPRHETQCVSYYTEENIKGDQDASTSTHSPFEELKRLKKSDH